MYLILQNTSFLLESLPFVSVYNRFFMLVKIFNNTFMGKALHDSGNHLTSFRICKMGLLDPVSYMFYPTNFF